MHKVRHTTPNLGHILGQIPSLGSAGVKDTDWVLAFGMM